MSFFRYIFILFICYCLWMTFFFFFFIFFFNFKFSNYTFWDFCKSDFLSHQLILLFFELLFWTSFKCICCRLFIMVIKILGVFTIQGFTYILANIFTHNFRKRQKPLNFYKYLIFMLNWIAHHFLCFTL